MTDWKSVKLGEVAAVQTGPFGSQLHESDYVKDGTPIITVENLIGGKIQFTSTTPLVASADVQRLSRYTLKEGDVVFSRVGAVDRSAYCTVKADGWMFSGRILRVRPNRTLDPKYLNYYLSLDTIKNRIRNHAVGGTMASLNTGILNQVPIVVPPADEQKRIVAVLETWDKYLEKLDGKIELKKNIKQGLMSRYFTPSKDTLPLKRLLISFATGLNPRQNFKLGVGQNYYVTIKNISKGKLNFKNAEKVNDTAIAMIARRSKLAKNDVIMSSIGNIGEAYLLKKDPDRWNINESVFALKPDTNKILPAYLYYMITSEYSHRFFENHMTGSSFKSIKMKDLKELPVNNISIDDQQAIASVLAVVDQEIDALENKRKLINEQRSYLLKSLISCKIRTPENLTMPAKEVQYA